MYRALARNLPNIAILVFDRDYRYLLADGKALEKQGFSKSLVEGRTIDEVLPPANAAKLKPLYDAALSGEHIHSEREFDGRFYEVDFMPFLDDERNIIAGMALTRDITARKKVELELLASRDNLQLLVAERTLQLEEKAKKLEIQNQELDAFARTVAHDIKAPLHGLVGFSELLLHYRQELHGDTKEIEASISQLAWQTSNIVDELLMLSRLHQDELQFEPIDMNLIIQNALVRIKHEAFGKPYQVDMVDSFPTAVGYAPWVEEIFVNYFSNAVKYGGDPAVVQVGYEHVDRGWRYWVKDNGRGLTQAEQDKLFVPFARLEQVQVPGTGLGLSIVKRIVTKLEGRSGVDSEIGNGSCFWFELPAFQG
jgi:PAS domain S-box-containing protein